MNDDESGNKRGNRAPVHHAPRGGVLLLTTLLLCGCWNGDNDTIRLGDVSLGQQLLDLQRAREAGALDEAEYQRLRSHFIELMLQATAPGSASGSPSGSDSGAN